MPRTHRGVVVPGNHFNEVRGRLSMMAYEDSRPSLQMGGGGAKTPTKPPTATGGEGASNDYYNEFSPSKGKGKGKGQSQYENQPFNP